MFAKAIIFTGLCLACLMLQIGAEQHNGGAFTNVSFEQEDTSKFGRIDTDTSNDEIIRPETLLKSTQVIDFKQNPDGSFARIESDENLLTADETVKLSSELTWHVGVYAKYRMPYMQICGGTLVTTKAVISAAHCFWRESEGVLPAAYFAVGAGKHYRPWNDPQDSFTQNSDVEAIHIPVRYQGAAANYQEDIAVLLLATEMQANFAVKPACVDFGGEFDDDQLRHGNLGTILGWGLTEEDGRPSPVLNYVELPSVDTQECLARVDPSFIPFITSDKICAGGSAGKAMCRGDSGGGLIFFDDVGSMRVPYLRGVASTAPRNGHACNAQAPSALTHVRAHRAFLRKHIPGLKAECKKHFKASETLQDKTGPVQPVVDKPVQCVCNCFCNNDPAPSQECPVPIID